MDFTDFERFYQEYKHRIYSYLFYRSGRRRELAEDLTAEVFMKALEKFHTYHPDRSFKSWIFTIAHHHLIDFFRKRKETADLEALGNVLVSDSDPKQMLNRSIAAEQVATLLPTLSDEEQEILLLRYHEDLPMKEIAHLVEKREPTVRVIIHRALAKLRKHSGALSFSPLLLFITFVS